LFFIGWSYTSRLLSGVFHMWEKPMGWSYRKGLASLPATVCEQRWVSGCCLTPGA
jgi:hypothetical protein